MILSLKLGNRSGETIRKERKTGGEDESRKLEKKLGEGGD